MSLTITRRVSRFCSTVISSMVSAKERSISRRRSKDWDCRFCSWRICSSSWMFSWMLLFRSERSLMPSRMLCSPGVPAILASEFTRALISFWFSRWAFLRRSRSVVS